MSKDQLSNLLHESAIGPTANRIQNTVTDFYMRRSFKRVVFSKY